MRGARVATAILVEDHRKYVPIAIVDYGLPHAKPPTAVVPWEQGL